MPDHAAAEAEHPGLAAQSRFMSVLLWWMQPKIGIPTLMVLMVLIGPMANRAVKLARVPDPPVPFDVEAFQKDIVPDEMNAAASMVAATKLITKLPPAESANFNAVIDQGWASATPGVQQWVRENRPAIDAWREASRMPDLQYVKPGALRIDTPLPMIQESRQLNRLLRLEAERLRLAGEPVESLEMLLDGLRAGELIGKRGTLIEYLVSAALLSESGLQLLDWAADSQVSDELVQRALNESLKSAREPPRVSHAVKLEYLWLQGFVKNTPITEIGTMLGTGGGFEDALIPLLYFQGEPLITAKAAAHMQVRTLEQVDKRRHQRTKTSGRHSIFEPDPSGSGTKWSAADISRFLDETHFASVLGTSMWHIVDAHDANLARYEMLPIALALEVFRCQHGQYPDRLTELVPKLLTSLPSDALAPIEQPLGYRRDGESAKLWSVGKDGVDDGGRFSRAWNTSDSDFGLFFGPSRAAAREASVTDDQLNR